MLTKLEIQNYILIDQLNIDLSEQFSVITGETGAGKSIIMGALGLILGDRADSTVCREASKKCFIEGIFKITNNAQLQTLFQENEIELSDELIIRREISAQGKSRAFINDTPVTLTTLKEVTSHLVDLHQQFDTLTLGDTDFQRTVIDALASNQKELASYQAIFTHWKEKEKKLDSLIAQKEDFEKTLSYKQHLFEELSGAQFQENELENLVTGTTQNDISDKNTIFFKTDNITNDNIQYNDMFDYMLNNLSNTITESLPSIFDKKIKINDINSKEDPYKLLCKNLIDYKVFVTSIYSNTIKNYVSSCDLYIFSFEDCDSFPLFTICVARAFAFDELEPDFLAF